MYIKYCCRSLKCEAIQGRDRDRLAYATWALGMPLTALQGPALVFDAAGLLYVSVGSNNNVDADSFRSRVYSEVSQRRFSSSSSSRLTALGRAASRGPPPSPSVPGSGGPPGALVVDRASAHVVHLQGDAVV